MHRISTVSHTVCSRDLSPHTPATRMSYIARDFHGNCACPAPDICDSMGYCMNALVEIQRCREQMDQCRVEGEPDTECVRMETHHAWKCPRCERIYPDSDAWQYREYRT